MATKKFELAKKELELKNQLAVLNNEQIVELPDWVIRNRAEDSTISSLKYNIEFLERQIVKKEFENKVAAYWEEHQEDYKRLQEERVDYKITFKDTNKRCVEEISCYIFGNLNLVVSSLYFGWEDTKIVVGISTENAEADNETGCTPTLFGHNFDIFYRTKHDYKTDTPYRQLEMNYGTMGTFDVMNDTSRIQALVAMGSFAGNEQFKKQLISIIEKYEAEIKKIRDAVNAIDNKLANPFE